MRRTRLTAAVLSAAVVAGGLALTGPAVADPPAGTYRQLVGVGSDTTQDVVNALAGDTVNGTSYSATAVTADGAGIASYDAIEPGTGSTTSTIQTRSGGPSFLRPNGSGKGRLALSESLTGDLYPDGSGVSIAGQVDFARSSGGPKVSGTALTYIPLARDAVGVAAKGSALQNLTVDQLHDIYSGTLTQVNGQTVHPYIPQSGSGTRAFFLGAIGLTDATLSPNVTAVEENQADNVVTTDGALVPFSVASWIAQANGVAPDRSSTAVAGGAYLAGLELPGAAVFTNPVQTVSGKLAPVADYYNNATFGRDVYDVVPSRAIDPTSVFFDKALYDVFVTGSGHTAATASDSAESVISAFGFLNEPYNGSVNPAQHAKLGGLEESGASQALPGTPVLTATPGSGSLALKWTAPADTGLPVTDYRVVVTADADGTVVRNKDFSAATTSYTALGLPPGAYTATVYADNLNGAGAPATKDVAVKYASFTSASAPTTAYGKVPHVNVTVSDFHSVVPTGTVTVKEGATVRGTGILGTGGKVSIALSRYLSIGTHTLTLVYGGAGKLYPSQTSTTLKITKTTPTVATSAPTSVSHLSHGKVTVTVSADHVTPTGLVRIYEGTTWRAAGTLVGGKVTITLPLLSRGSHTLHAYYVGSATVNPRSGVSFIIHSS